MNFALPSTALLVIGVFAVSVSSADYDAGLAAFESGHYENALDAWQPLAEGGDKRAQWGLGMMYSNGFGVEMNDAEALKWFELSATQGFADAQYRIGVMQQNGWGLPMDDVAAADWFEKAAEQGHTEAQVALGQIYAAEYAPIYDPVKAYKWFAIATALGDIDAHSKRDEYAARVEAGDLEQAKALASEWLDRNKTLQAQQ
ncbi:MAG: sel1 repeat family protein [Gammaproteobacteria bacterium]|nr:sel1 repeat family protein [Gammaproteobacteria bacterium]